MYREASAISDEAREVVPNNSLEPRLLLADREPRRATRAGAATTRRSREDPLLTAEIASQFVDGMEGKDERRQPAARRAAAT